MNTHNLCFDEKYHNFLSENFHVLVVKFSVYLNRHVFTMHAIIITPDRCFFNQKVFIFFLICP